MPVLLGLIESPTILRIDYMFMMLRKQYTRQLKIWKTNNIDRITKIINEMVFGG